MITLFRDAVIASRSFRRGFLDVSWTVYGTNGRHGFGVYFRQLVPWFPSGERALFLTKVVTQSLQFLSDSRIDNNSPEEANLIDL
jgi:hypothetical protein